MNQRDSTSYDSSRQEKDKTMIRVMLDNPKRNSSRAVSFEASVDGKALLRSSVPIYDSARALLALDHSPETLMTARHAGKDFDSIKPAKLGDLAKWTVTERDRDGLGRQRWVPHPGQDAISSPLCAPRTRESAPAGPTLPRKRFATKKGVPGP